MAKIAPVNIPTFIFGAKIQIQNSILATIRMSWFFLVIFKRCESYKPLNQVHRLLRDPQYHHWSMVRPESCYWPKFQQVVKVSTSTYSFPAGCCANTTTDTFRQRLFYKARKGGASPFLRGLFFLADHLDWAGWILCSQSSVNLNLSALCILPISNLLFTPLLSNFVWHS